MKGLWFLVLISEHDFAPWAPDATRPQNFTCTLWIGQTPLPSVAHSSQSFRSPTGQWWLLAPPRSLYWCPQQHLAEPDVIAPLPFVSVALGRARHPQRSYTMVLFLGAG